MGAIASRLSDRSRLLLVWLVLLAAPFVAPNDYVFSLANMLLINVILIASLNLLMGYGGQISLGHAGFFGLGAYVSGVLNVKLAVTAWIGLPAAALITALAAVLIGIPVLRLRGLYLSMATLGWNAIVVVLFNRLVDLTGGPNGLLGVAPFSIGGLRLDTEPVRATDPAECPGREARAGQQVQMVGIRVVARDPAEHGSEDGQQREGHGYRRARHGPAVGEQARESTGSPGTRDGRRICLRRRAARCVDVHTPLFISD